MSAEPVEELRALAERLKVQASQGERAEIQEPLAKVEHAADRMGKAWSGSNMGYQSRVYYADFEVPPPGAHFDSEWGFLGQLHGTTGDWREYQFDEVVELAYRTAGVQSLDQASQTGKGRTQRVDERSARGGLNTGGLPRPE